MIVHLCFACIKRIKHIYRQFKHSTNEKSHDWLVDSLLFLRHVRDNLTSGLSLTFYLRYRIEDLITHHYWSCSVIIILTNQSLLLCDWNYFGSFDLLIWVEYMPEVTRKHNKMTFIIFKNTALRLKNTIWLVEIMMQYANTNFIQSSL